MPSAAKGEWELPRLKLAYSLADDSRFFSAPAPAEFFDVKFYPYSPKGTPPIFAAISKKHIIICRITQKETHPCEVIGAIRDDDPLASSSGCCWSKDVETGMPLLCVAGDDAKIKVYDVKERKLVNTLVGHGAGINDLTTCPTDPTIIASGSEDFTVRIWSLRPEHAKQPCVGLLGGHSRDLLTLAFHNNGRYLLSAGHDQVINLWLLPEVPSAHVDAPIVLHYPHFSSQEIHNSLVDCVSFFGDLVISRACHENTIVLWRIEGFNSEDAPPSRDQAPSTHDPRKQTRSAFAPVLSKGRPMRYTRLLRFSTVDCNVQFFMRFRLFHEPGKHPILAFCNTKSKIFFWDLERLTAYRQFMGALEEAKQTEKGAHPQRPGWLQVKKGKKEVAGKGTAISQVRAQEKESNASASPDPDAAAGQPYSQKTLREWAEMYDISSDARPLLPHRTVQATSSTDSTFVGRQVAWSPGGEWCVVVGSGNRAVVCHRWAHGGKDMVSATPTGDQA